MDYSLFVLVLLLIIFSVVLAFFVYLNWQEGKEIKTPKLSTKHS